jgi:hypothetical protein
MAEEDDRALHAASPGRCPDHWGEEASLGPTNGQDLGRVQKTFQR